jgi:hypothetical protein
MCSVYICAGLYTCTMYMWGVGFCCVRTKCEFPSIFGCHINYCTGIWTVTVAVRIIYLGWLIDRKFCIKGAQAKELVFLIFKFFFQTGFIGVEYGFLENPPVERAVNSMEQKTWVFCQVDAQEFHLRSCLVKNTTARISWYSSYRLNVQSRTITNCTVAFFTFLLMLFVQYSKYIGFKWNETHTRNSNTYHYITYKRCL